MGPGGLEFCVVISLAQLLGGYLICVTSFRDSGSFCKNGVCEADGLVPRQNEWTHCHAGRGSNRFG